MAAKPDRGLLICANPKCDFLVHEDEQFGGFCCKRCHWCLEREQSPEHGEKCCRLPAPPDAVRAELTPPELPMSVLRAKNRNKRPKKQAAEVSDAPMAVLPEGPAVSRRPRPPDKPPPPPPSGRGGGGGRSASASAPARKSRRADTREKYLDEKDDEHRDSSHDGRNRMRTQRRSRRTSSRSRSRSRNSGESREASRQHRRRRRSPREVGRDGKERLAHKSSSKAQDGDRATASDRRQAGGHASRRSEAPPQKSTPAPQAVKPDAAPSKADSIIVGDKVEIVGMSKKPKLNGMLGKVVEVHEEPKGRKFDVRIMDVPGNSREKIQGVLRKVGAAYLCKVVAETT